MNKGAKSKSLVIAVVVHIYCLLDCDRYLISSS